MTDIRLRLDDTNFERLVETARSLIPTYAPAWTDHNLHDPGITLIELVAWIAEAQIYSLGRTRRDERWAYGSLLGIQPRGPVPATGLIWPMEDTQTLNALARTTAIALKKGTKVTATGLDAPNFSLSEDIFVTAARLERVATVTADRTTIDWTSSNTRDGAPIRPFGDTPDRRTRFILEFVGPLGLPAEISSTALTLSLGIRTKPLSTATVKPTAHTDQLSSVTFDAILIHAGGEHTLHVRDSTQGFLKTGLLLLQFPADFRDVKGNFSIELSIADGEFSSPPEILTVRPNVLPVAQLENIGEELYLGTGLPDQSFTLKKTGIIYSATGNSVTVNVERAGKLEPWNYSEHVEHADPTSKLFAVDWNSGTVLFGNGVNGAIPEAGGAIQVGYSVSSGGVGNLSTGLDWVVSGIHGSFGTNRDPMSGGLDSLTLDDLRREARIQVRDTHPLVTTSDLESAATALADLHVARAHELTPLPTQKVPSGTRTLVAVRTRDHSTEGLSNVEPASWLSEIRRRLAARLPLGERLRVIAPSYKDITIRARLMAARGLDPKAVAERAKAALTRELAVVANSPNGPQRRLGRDIVTTEVLGWLRRVDGVQRVLNLELLENGIPVTHVVHLGRAGLPRLRMGNDDLVVERLPLGAPR